ncbi:LysR family transcriptional regulator [Paenibacillus tarimensis]|uniref:LysR family transcriptional regulator n=1 Tax=Paenibacillus tarimensis TaxID=416012 RepID=UPI001F1B1B97|nr:LysR family transcriptional regulator [Paenibacillus tarimensis]MCF2943109.1 LysR family transcriptional regulator [Paenibacillus tarimensis]
MSLLKLKILRLIGRYKQVTAVANALGMKQPTVSFHMKKMENEWGVKLFQVRNGRVLLTDAGRLLLPYAKQIDTLYTEALERMEEIRNGCRNYRIGCSSIMAAALGVTDKLTLWMEESGSTVSVTTGNEHTLQEYLTEGLIDVLFTGRIGKDPGGSEVMEIIQSPVCLLASASHPLAAAQNAVEGSKLSGYEFVLHTSLTEQLLTWAAANHLTINSPAFSDSVDFIVNTVTGGRFLTLLPEAVLGEWNRGRLIRLDLNEVDLPVWHQYAIWPDQHVNTESIRTLLTYLMDPGH